MKHEQPMCWYCVWRHIVGPGNDPTLSCGHPSDCVRKQFRGSSTAETCKEYVEDDPAVKVKVTRDTRETFMRAVHQMAVDSGDFAEAEGILDYFLPDTRNSPTEITCDAFDFIAIVNFGSNEGIYLDCYAEGRISEDGEKGRWHLGTYKTLGTSLSDIQIFGKLSGTLTYFARRYLWYNAERFLSDRELRVHTIKEKLKKTAGK